MVGRGRLFGALGAPGSNATAGVRLGLAGAIGCALALLALPVPVRADIDILGDPTNSSLQVAGPVDPSSPSLSQMLGLQSGTPLMLGFGLSPSPAQTGSSAASASGISLGFYAPAATDSAGTPLPGAMVPTTTGLSENLMLANPNPKSSSGGISLSGVYYVSNGSHALGPGAGKGASAYGAAISQAISYKSKGLSFGFGYSDVARAFAGADALKAMAGQQGGPDAAAIGDLLKRQGQSDLNFNLGFAGSGGVKAGFALDNLTDQNAKRHTQTETLSFEQDTKSGLGFSITHGMVMANSLLGGSASDSTNDHLHLAFAPTHSGFSLNADQTFTRNPGSGNDQTALNLGDKFSGFNFTGNIVSTQVTGNSPDRSTSEQMHLDGNLSHSLSFVTTWNGAADEHNPWGAKNDFDTQLKETFAKDVLGATEFVSKVEGKNRSDDWHTTLSLPSFAGMAKPMWSVDLADQEPFSAPAVHKWDIAFDSTLPTVKTRLPETLSGAGLHLEYADCSAGSPCQPGQTSPAYAASTIKVVSGPSPGNRLSWSIFQQIRSAAGGLSPSVRDYQIQMVLLRGLTLAYANADQIILPNGSVKDTKTQDLKLATTLRGKRPVQLTAEYMAGADRADCLAETQTASVGVSAPAGAKGSLNMSVGRTGQVGLDGGYAYGTTYKMAYNCPTSQTDLINFTSTITYWDSGGSRLVACPVQATAQLSFKRTYW